MKTVSRPILLRTSSRNDVKFSGGDYIIAGLPSVSRKDITSVKQVKYRAEVAQVVTIAATSYTPGNSTRYAVQVWDANRSTSGSQESVRVYTYVTPADVSILGNAAAQREAITAALVTAINNDGGNRAVALSLGTGTGFTVTDDGGYYPQRSQSMTNVLGANTVLPMTNSDGTGYASTNYVNTTAAVSSFGVGATLLAEKPVLDAIYGNLTSGDFDAPLTQSLTASLNKLPAVSGQKYDAFFVNSLQRIVLPTITDKFGYIERVDAIFVDNGCGSDTANLTGYKAFERQMHKVIASQYKHDENATIEFFDKKMLFQADTGTTPYTGALAGTANLLSSAMSPYGSFDFTCIGTQTIFGPTLTSTGLLLDQDDNSGDGSHYSANQQTLGAQEFVVGQQEFSVLARVVAGDWTDTQFMVGFRKKAAYTADYNDYTDLGAIGGAAADGDSITTQGILANAATVATDTTINFADGVSMLLLVKVALDGTVSCYIAAAGGGWVKYPVYSVGTTALVFAVDTVMIPFFQHVNIGSGDPAVVISEWVAFASNDWTA